MRTLESRLDDRRHLPDLRTPKSFGTKPVVFAPHPPLVSGGWYQGVDQEVLGPSRYPVRCPNDKTATSAVLWSVLCGPLGLCYLSVAGGLVAAALTVALLVLTGSAVVLTVAWVLAVVLSPVAVTHRG